MVAGTASHNTNTLHYDLSFNTIIYMNTSVTTNNFVVGLMSLFLTLFVLVGLFMRHMLLAYNKLSFSQVFKLYKSLQQYCNKDRWTSPSSGPQPELPSGANEDMEMTSTEDTSVDRVDGMDRGEPDAGPLHHSELW